MLRGRLELPRMSNQSEEITCQCTGSLATVSSSPGAQADVWNEWHVFTEGRFTELNSGYSREQTDPVPALLTLTASYRGAGGDQGIEQGNFRE